MANAASPASQSLMGTYTSPTATHTLSSALPPLPLKDSSVDDKTEYLSCLRSNVSQMQDDINAYLTQKMEEDKAQEAGVMGKRPNKDEDRQEEMYGEEDAEEDG